MNEIKAVEYFLPPIAALVFFAALRFRARRRRARHREQGRHLIYWLKAYSAWVDCQRDEPFVARNIDELASPQPLARALRIKDESFPELSQHMLRLLQAHSRLIEYL